VTTVREAVKGLESTGVLETRRGAGVYVREFSFTPLLDHLPYGLMSSGGALRDLIAVRKALETSMIGDAIDALQPATVDQLQSVVDEMAHRSAEGQGVLEQDRAFHRLLFSDLGNAMLLQLLDLFWEAYHRAAPDLPGDSDPNEVYRMHKSILDAVLEGDSSRATQAMQQHYAGIEAKVGE
jgi:DNA-binding FadR family transcriptional regulator